MVRASSVCVASLVRITALAEFMRALDVTWHMGPVFIWSSVEPSIGILSACLPSLRPLWSHLRAKVSSYYPSHDDHQSRNTQESKTFGAQKSPRSRGFKKIHLTREEDEISLTNIATGGPAKQGLTENGIFVHSNFQQSSSPRAE